MRTHLDCYACFLNQALRTSRLVTDDVRLQKEVLDQVAGKIQAFPLSASPPEMAVFIYETIERVCRVRDPYRHVKEETNRQMLDLLPEFRHRVAAARDPLLEAIQLAIAGNAIDFGSTSQVDAHAVLQQIPIETSPSFAFDTFRRALQSSPDVLYLGDNSGEIVLDRLLIETMDLPTCFVVRGAPVINDVTLADAERIDMAQVAQVMDNGDCAPGTILSRCSESLRRRFNSAQLIVSKGQGNFETLSAVPAPIFFMLRVKCRVVSKKLGVPRGSAVLLPSELAQKRWGRAD